MEIFWKGAWVVLPDATAHQVKDNQYRVIIPESHRIMLTRDARKLDGLRLRLDGREMYSVVGMRVSEPFTAELEGLA